MTNAARRVFRFRSVFPETPIITLADIGAGDDPNQPLGLEALTGLCTTGDAILYGFDGDERSFGAVAEQQTDSRHYLPYFIGDGGEHTFYETNSAFTGSLYRPNRAVIDQFNAVGELMIDRRSFRVQTRRLDDVEELPPVDAMKLDVQGAELDVLRGAPRQLETTLLVQCEVEFIPLYENQPLFGDIDAFLRDHGFLLLNFGHMHRRLMKPTHNPKTPSSPGAQVLWTDGIFIRDFRSISSLSVDQALKLASILHDAYGFVDVACFILEHLDKRDNGERLKVYAARLQALASA